MREELTIGIVGAGGDGVVVMGSLLQRISASLGYYSQMPRYYGAQIRGGGSAVKLGINSHGVSLPRETIDILFCFHWQKYAEVENELRIGPETLVLCENPPPDETGFQYNLVDLASISQETTKSDRNRNMVGLGMLLALVCFPQEEVANMAEVDGELKLVKENWAAVTAGIQATRDLPERDYHLSSPADQTPKVILHGNAAMGQAAIRAGCHAYFGYPITPAAEIMQEMQKRLPEVSGVFLQAEDEIAAAGFLVGTSMTGAKTMTGTSGPGLDLMTEVMGLAISAEIPMVIIDVQRCGPSTGIPSKSEQSDLNHAIYGGHGDGPRVVLAAYDVESCFRLTIESFNIAEFFQVPVILLSDQWLGQTYVGISGDFLTREYKLSGRKMPAGTEEYCRYQQTTDGISPIANVGDPGLMYRTSGLTHDIKGSPAFDAETHHALHEKRYKKLMPLTFRDELVQIAGNESASSGIITWGSSAQIVRDTLIFLGLENRIKICVPELICPLPGKVDAFVKSVEHLLVIEMNYSGQLYRYLRSQIDLPADTRIHCRAGGRPFSRSELHRPIEELCYE